MKISNHTPDPFTVHALSQGPAYIEQLFDEAVGNYTGTDTAQLAPAKKYRLYIDYMQGKIRPVENVRDRLFYFYTGFFMQRYYICLRSASKPVPKENELLSYIAEMYRFYLSGTNGYANEDTLYYARWQCALITGQLGAPWPEVMRALLECVEADPLRAECTVHIIDHFVSCGEWATAYLFSAHCAGHFYKREPSGIRTWYVDPDCYNWKMVTRHIKICNAIGKRDEAKEHCAYIIDDVNRGIFALEQASLQTLRQIFEELHQPGALN